MSIQTAAGPASAAPPTATTQSSASAGADNPDIVSIVVPDKATAERLVGLGVDLAEYYKPVAGGVEVHAVVTEDERAALKADGFDVRGTVISGDEMAAVSEERAEAVRALAAADAAADSDTLTVLRAEWFTSVGGQAYLSTEVRSSLGEDSTTVIKATWDGREVTLSRFVDAGEYLYHRMSEPIPVTSPPTTITFTSNKGGEVTVPVTKWLGERDEPDPNYATGFVDHYMDPQELTARIQSLAAEFPNLAEIIDLPNKTNGYQRKAQLTVGNTGRNQPIEATFYVTSKAWGQDGGNDLTLALAAPAAANAALGVVVSGNNVTVNLASNAEGAVSSTANDVVAALNSSAAASALLTATLFRTSPGTGVVAPLAQTALTDNLSAPASVNRGPFAVKAIRIGKVRDGSKTGVFAYAQEHAREGVTPRVAVETAERLLRNYATDPETKKLVDDLDIFIMPTVNPDGANYSLYDFNSQRKNMTDHCGPTQSDPETRNSWGVDLNRNFSVGSYFDGYVGGSGSCTSGTYSGPSELSEPEARNEVYLTDTFDNIKFAMNIHSYGGYFMWPPGAYKAEGRESLPRPSYGEESYFWAASNTILEAVQDYRGTATWPGRTGPVIDVLYSAAGNSADEVWYNKGIYGWDFEVGADKWDAAAQRWRAVGFQPDFAEGFDEAMEFSNGLIGMLEVARAYELDDVAPRSHLVVKSRTATTTTFSFETSEPATVHYTLDGSRPTMSSPELQNAGLRQGAESFTVSNDTVVNWFAVDAPGNIESGYEPGVSGDFYNSWVVTAGGTGYDDLSATLSELVNDDRLAGHVERSLRDRLVRAQALATAGSETRTIGLLEQFIARARNQVKGDAGDVAVREALVFAAEQWIEQLRTAEEAENRDAA
jgi:hypothetical protein